jgi:exonuclease VII small subunit
MTAPADAAEPSGADDDATLDELVGRLERAAEQLRSGDLSADAAATLVEDCAALASQASAELDRRTREAGRDPLPGQDSLL